MELLGLSVLCPLSMQMVQIPIRVFISVLSLRPFLLLAALSPSLQTPRTEAFYHLPYQYIQHPLR